MTNSQIFKAAHKIAKEIAAKVGNYMIAMSIALKEVYASMKKSINEQLAELGFVKMNEWRDRIYINLEGNGGNYRGERSAKVWFKPSEGELNVELGKGVCSSEWHEQLEQVKAIFA